MTDEHAVVEVAPVEWTKRIPLALFVVGILLVGIVAYWNSFYGEFVFDDHMSIVLNPYIRHLWPLSDVVKSVPEQAVAGRPLVSISLAVNYAISGKNPWSYHAFNLLMHLLAGLTLFGVARRTFLAPRLKDAFSGAANLLAFCIAAVWTVHPIQTESVTYIVQRAESMAGLFYLLTLYCVIRNSACEKWSKWLWGLGAVAACAAGMASKETMVTAPLVIFIYDRIFLADSWKALLKRRGLLYAGLAATWAILAAIMLAAPRGKTTGFGIPDLNGWQYARSQFGVIVHYLSLSFWPHPLVLDYGWPVADDWRQILMPAAGILFLLGLTVYALVRRPALGFLGVWFFLILAPTSSIVPIMDLCFEHRMYLPLVAVISGAVVAAYIIFQRRLSAAAVPYACAVAAGVALACFVALTIHRNADYQNEIILCYKDTIRRPNNFRAFWDLGQALMAKDKMADAVKSFQRSIEINPKFPTSHGNMGVALLELGKLDEAEKALRTALSIKPMADIHNNLGRVLARKQDYDGAEAEFRESMRLSPKYPYPVFNLGTVRMLQGRYDEAIRFYEQALALQPDYRDARENLSNLHLVMGEKAKNDDPSLAAQHFHAALAVEPGNLKAVNAMAWLLATCRNPALRDPAQAIALAQNACEETAFSVPELLDTLAAAYAAAGQFFEAVRYDQQALDMVKMQGRKNLADEYQARLELYKAQKPFVQPGN